MTPNVQTGMRSPMGVELTGMDKHGTTAGESGRQGTQPSQGQGLGAVKPASLCQPVKNSFCEGGKRYGTKTPCFLEVELSGNFSARSGFSKNGISHSYVGDPRHLRHREAAWISSSGGRASDNKVVDRTFYIPLNPVISKDTGRRVCPQPRLMLIPLLAALLCFQPIKIWLHLTLS